MNLEEELEVAKTIDEGRVVLDEMLKGHVVLAFSQFLHISKKDKKSIPSRMLISYRRLKSTIHTTFSLTSHIIYI